MARPGLAPAHRVCLSPIECSPVPDPSPPPDFVHQAYWDFHNAVNTCPRPDDLRHPLISGAFVSIPWSAIEPQPGRFVWCALDEHIDVWAAAGRKVIIRSLVSGTNESPDGVGGRVWPDWMCCDNGTPGACVECIEYCENPTSTSPTALPVTWNSPAFLDLYGDYVAALGARYDGDARIAYVWIGVGHLGFLTATPSRGGDCALLDAGWTPEIWEQHIVDVIDLYAANFQQTPLLLAVTPLWSRSFSSTSDAADFEAALLRVVDHAVAHGASILLNGLNECPETYAATQFSAVLDHLATLSLPDDFTLFMGDDFPLWSVDRGDDAFRCLLQTVRLEWLRRMQSQGRLAIKLQRNEVRASNAENAEGVDPDVQAILTEFLNNEPSVDTIDADDDGVVDACLAFSCTPNVTGSCRKPPTQCFGLPTVSANGLLILAVLTAGGGAGVIRRRRIGLG